MSTIDTSILLQGRPAQFDPMQGLQQGLTLRHVLEQRQFATKERQAKQMAKERADAEEKVARRIWATSGGDTEKIERGLMGAGLIEQYQSAAKAFDERAKSRASAGKDLAETGLKQQSYLRQFATRLNANRSDEQIAAQIAGAVEREEISREQAMSIGDMLAITPRQEWGKAMMQLISSPEDWLKLQTPDIKAINDGQQTHFVDQNAMTNPNQAPLQMQASPEALLTDARGQQSNRIAAGQLAVAQGNLAQRRAQDAIQTQLAQGNLSVAQQRLALDQQAPRGTPMVTADGQSGLIDPRTGVFRPAVDQNGQPIQQGKVAEERITKVRQAQEALQVADQIEGVLPNATGSHLGNIRDQAAAAFGQSTQGAQAIAQLRVLGTKLIQQVPRFEGPQSDRDVQLYKEAAGDLANPSVPMQTKQAALQTIRVLNQQYLQQQGQAGQQGLGTGRVSGQVQQAQPMAQQPQQPRQSGGASGGWDAPAPQTLQAMPMPRDVPVGAVITDNSSGRRFRNDGNSWVPVK